MVKVCNSVLVLYKQLEAAEKDHAAPQITKTAWDFSYATYTDSDFALLLQCFDRLANIGCLSALELANTNMGPDRLAQLIKIVLPGSGATRPVYLQFLDLSGNPLEDCGIKLLAESIQVGSSGMWLRSISIRYVNCAHAGALALAKAIEATPQLTYVHLDGNPFLTATGELCKVQEPADGRVEISSALLRRCGTHALPQLLTGCPIEQLDKTEMKAASNPARILYKNTDPRLFELMEIVAFKNKKQFDVFLKQNKDFPLDTPHPDGFTVAHVAAVNGQHDILKALHGAGVSTLAKLPVDLPEPTPKWLLTGGGKYVRISLPRRSSPLTFAVSRVNSSCVAFLVGKCKAPSDFPNAHGLFPSDYVFPRGATNTLLPNFDRQAAMQLEQVRLQEIQPVQKVKKSKKKGKGKK